MGQQHRVDVHIHMQWPAEAGAAMLQELIVVRFVSGELDVSGKPTAMVLTNPEGSHYHMKYSDGAEFLLDTNAKTITVRRPDNCSQSTVGLYLTGPVLGFYLRLLNVVCLHASAVLINDGVVAFVGPSGAGKSTLAAAFHKDGYLAYTDDILPIKIRDKIVYAQSGHQRIRLWPASVNMLYGQEVEMPQLTSGWDKRYLELVEGDSQNHQTEPRRLLAIYCFDGAAESPNTVCEISSCSPVEGFRRLVANTYRGELLGTKERVDELRQLSDLLETVPIKIITGRRDPVTLKEYVLQDMGKRPH